MIAPSEKHLEDYIWNHPECLGTNEYPPDYRTRHDYTLMFRQFCLPSGIVDMIGFDYRLCLFELKKGVLTAQALTQLMRYMRDANWLVEHLLFSLTDQDTCHPWLNRYWAYDGFDVSPILRGVLIGTDVEDDNFLVACAGCGIDVFLYDYNGTNYTFDAVNVPDIILKDNETSALFNIIEGRLGKAFIAHFQNDILAEYKSDVEKHNKAFLAERSAEDYIKSLGGDA